MTKSKTGPNWSLLFTIAVLVMVLSLYIFSQDFRSQVQSLWELLQSGDYQQISGWFQELKGWGPLVIVLTMVVQMFLVILPSWGLMVVSVMAYGPVWGALLAIVAVGVASTVGYFIGKAFGKAALQRITGKRSGKKVSEFIEHYGFGAVFLFRLSPLLSSDAISIVGGMLHMNFWRFMTATLLGITPLAIAIAYFGSEADRLKSGLYWLGGIGLVLYLGYVIWDYRHRRGKS